MDRLANFVNWFCHFASKSTFRRVAIVTTLSFFVYSFTVITLLTLFYLIDRLDLFSHVYQLKNHFEPKSYLGFMCGCLSFITCFMSIAVPATFGLSALVVEYEVLKDLNTYLKRL